MVTQGLLHSDNVDHLRQWLKSRLNRFSRSQDSRVQTAAKWDSNVELLVMKERNGASNVSTVASYHAKIHHHCHIYYHALY